MDKLTDITIVVDGESFEMHKAILCLYSDYFTSLLTNGMKESSQKVIHLTGSISLEQFKLFKKYIYSENDTILGSEGTKKIVEECINTADWYMSKKYLNALENELIDRYGDWDMDILQVYILACNHNLYKAISYSITRIRNGSSIIRRNPETIEELLELKPKKIYDLVYGLYNGGYHKITDGINHGLVCKHMPNKEMILGYIDYIIENNLTISRSRLKEICANLDQTDRLIKLITNNLSL